MTKLPQMDVPAPPPPIDPPPPPPPPAKPASKLRTYISVAVLVVIIGAVLYAVRNNTEADKLTVGTCFDRPTTGQDFSTVEKHDCGEAHDAEVVFVAEYTDSDTYPIALTLDSFTSDHCVPAVETYTGRAAEDIDDLGLGYISPNREGWDGGDRTITCYVYRLDEAQMTKSVKAGTAAPAAT